MIVIRGKRRLVPPDRQNEVLISLLETDPDVVDYLLRRKASQSSSPDMLRSEVSFSMGGRHSSTDSNKASSGDLSPYDNNSPVLSERSLLAMQEDVAPGGSEKLYKGPEQYVLVGHLPSSKSRESSPGPRLGKVAFTEDLPNTHAGSESPQTWLSGKQSHARKATDLPT
ncbi:hypothetical protein CB1_002210001 [Camelus ferus]|nr:hypothetical protein CB1_002210001 [Camelus ferus]